MISVQEFEEYAKAHNLCVWTKEQSDQYEDAIRDARYYRSLCQDYEKVIQNLNLALGDLSYKLQDAEQEIKHLDKLIYDFPEYENEFKEIEKALGFKLFTWQKTYIKTRQFRRYGETTAQILRELLTEGNTVTINYILYKRWYCEYEYKLYKKLLPTGLIKAKVLVKYGDKVIERFEPQESEDKE